MNWISFSWAVISILLSSGNKCSYWYYNVVSLQKKAENITFTKFSQLQHE